MDDEPTVLELVRLVIATSDAHTVAATAADTDSAVALAEETQPDAIITDLTIGSGPVAGGVYLNRLKQAAPSARIITFSGQAVPADGNLHGADAHLMKPADPEAILGALEGS